MSSFDSMRNKLKGKELNFRWVEQRAQYQIGQNVYLNKICVGSCHWNGERSQSIKDTSTDWIGNIVLPSLKETSSRVYGSTQDEVKAKVERIITSWFKVALRC